MNIKKIFFFETSFRILSENVYSSLSIDKDKKKTSCKHTLFYELKIYVDVEWFFLYNFKSVHLRIRTIIYKAYSFIAHKHTRDDGRKCRDTSSASIHTNKCCSRQMLPLRLQASGVAAAKWRQQRTASARAWKSLPQRGRHTRCSCLNWEKHPLCGWYLFSYVYIQRETCWKTVFTNFICKESFRFFV